MALPEALKTAFESATTEAALQSALKDITRYVAGIKGPTDMKADQAWLLGMAKSKHATSQWTPNVRPEFAAALNAIKAKDGAPGAAPVAAPAVIPAAAPLAPVPAPAPVPLVAAGPAPVPVAPVVAPAPAPLSPLAMVVPVGGPAPAVVAPPAPGGEEVPAAVLAQVLEMGFDREQAITALRIAGGRADAAVALLLSGEPLVPAVAVPGLPMGGPPMGLGVRRMSGEEVVRPPHRRGGPAPEPGAEQIAQLTEMGFTRERAIEALRVCENNADAAVNYLFAHEDGADFGGEEDGGGSAPHTPELGDEEGGEGDDGGAELLRPGGHGMAFDIQALLQQMQGPRGPPMPPPPPAGPGRP